MEKNMSHGFAPGLEQALQAVLPELMRSYGKGVKFAVCFDLICGCNEIQSVMMRGHHHGLLGTNFDLILELSRRTKI
jgi:hypothetical protein